MRQFSAQIFSKPARTAFLFSAFLFGIHPAATAQEAVSGDAPAALPAEQTLQDARPVRTVPVPPVPSGLKAETKEAGVTLSWKPFRPESGGSAFRILRHTKPITLSNYAEAEEAGTAEAGALFFTDTPSASGSFYYAVLPYDKTTGEQTSFFVPSENSLVFPVTFTVPAEPAQKTRITLFDVILKNQAVIIRWEITDRDDTVLLYRSTAPFENQTALTRATIIASLQDSAATYVDYPVPGVPYYYAAVPEAVIRSGTASFQYGENTNEIPVEVPAEYAGSTYARTSVSRAMPLPFLNIGSEKETQPVRFSSETEHVIASLIPPAGDGAAAQASSEKPYRFPEDFNAAGGEESALKQILDANFQTQQWNALYDALTAFLTLRRTAEVSARAHFYLGQACFFRGEYEEALQEFLLAQDIYYNKAREWTQKTLSKL